MRLTFNDCKFLVAQAVGMNSSDPRLYNYVNEATEQLLHMGRGQWVGCKGRYRLPVRQGIVSWPRRFEAIEHYALDGRVGIPRPMEFEFLDFGPGPMEYARLILSPLLPDRADSPIQYDPPFAAFRLRCAADVTEKAGQFLKVYGFRPDTRERVRTLNGADWQEGESLLVNTTPSDGAELFAGITGVLKPETNHYVRLYAVDVASGAEALLAAYEPDELRPSFRRSFIPRTPAETATATVIARHKFIPILHPDDFLLIQNIGAMKEMCMSIHKAQMNRTQEAEVHKERAREMLEDQLGHHEGAQRISLNVLGIQRTRTLGR